MIINQNINDMKIQETIKATEFTQEATVITLVSIPSLEDQKELFGNDESIVLEF